MAKRLAVAGAAALAVGLARAVNLQRCSVKR